MNRRIRIMYRRILTNQDLLDEISMNPIALQN